MQLAGAIDSRNCQPITSDVRILLDRKRAFAYPDYGVVCGKIEYDAIAWDAVTNPSLIVEVLSPSTAMYDTGTKASLYHALPSLKDLLLIGQEPVWIEHHHRVSASSWRIDLIVNFGASIHLESLNADISVDAIYAGTADIPAHSPQT